MTQPEPPPVIWFNGEIRPWAEATVHVWSEVAIRGTSVFEGLRAYWADDGSGYHVVSLDAHLTRLCRSARLMHFPESWSLEEIRHGIFALATALGEQGAPLYLRPTVYVEAGRDGTAADEVRLGTYVAGFPVPIPDSIQTGIRCLTSTRRRVAEVAMSPLIKAGAAYAAMRLPTIEARTRGFDDAILLNDRGTVAEATGAAIVMIHDGQFVTPPLHAGVLDSITCRNLASLAQELLPELVIVRREITPSELHTADEVFACGTLAEVRPIVNIDGIAIGDGTAGPVTRLLRDSYLERCHSPAAASSGLLTAVGR